MSLPISGFLSRMLLAIIHGYQRFVSPALPGRCRYYPTCSEYGKTAILWHGAGKGGWLTLKRIGSCHPLGGHGIDFVPLPLYKMVFTAIDNSVSRETLVGRGVYKDKISYVSRLNNTFKASIKASTYQTEQTHTKK
ncbi:membrane protein insertion efficiency factor YidD [Psychrobacter raelei]|uniref:membrane protein insertion efficiency factor YidD n=1 Tax=Psychrobacter raelei TaxID=2565531 RepID=UPI003F640FC7